MKHFEGLEVEGANEKGNIISTTLLTEYTFSASSCSFENESAENLRNIQTIILNA